MRRRTHFRSGKKVSGLAKKEISLIEFFPELELESLEGEKRLEMLGFLIYLEQIASLPKLYTISFSKEKEGYADFSLEHASIPKAANVIKSYFDLVFAKAEDNKEKAWGLVRKIYNEDKKVFGIFYCFFMCFLQKQENTTDECLKGQLTTAMQEASHFFFEKDVSAAIVHLMNVLKLSSQVDSQNSPPLAFVSYELFKEILFDVINEMPSNGKDNYFRYYLLYEIAKIDDNQQAKVARFDELLDAFDQAKEKVTNANCSKETILANYPYKLSSKMFFETIRKLMDEKNGKAILKYFEKIEIFISSFLDFQALDTVSFDRCFENYDYFIQETKYFIESYDIEKFNDIDSLAILRMTLHGLFRLVTLIGSVASHFYDCALKKEFFRKELTAYQQEQLEKIMHAVSISPSEHDRIKTLRVNLGHMFSPEQHTIKYIRDKTAKTARVTKELSERVEQMFIKVKMKHYGFLRSYIENFISKTIDPNEILTESNDASVVVFRLQKNYVRNIFKIPGAKMAVKIEKGNIQYSLDINHLTHVSLDDVLDCIVRAFCAQKTRDLAKKEKALEAGEEKKSEQENIIESQFHRILSFNDSIRSDALRQTDTIMSSDNETPEPIKKKIKRYQIIEEARDNKETHLSGFNKDKKQEKYLSALTEARKFFMSKNSLEEMPRCPYILNVVRCKTGRKHPLIIALSKELTFHGTTQSIPENEQKKINNFVKDISLVREAGQDGIKYCDHIYVLKLRNVEGSSYRAIANEQKLKSGAIVLIFNSITNKTHAKKPLRQAIEAKKRRKRK